MRYHEHGRSVSQAGFELPRLPRTFSRQRGGLAAGVRRDVRRRPAGSFSKDDVGSRRPLRHPSVLFLGRAG